MIELLKNSIWHRKLKLYNAIRLINDITHKDANCDDALCHMSTLVLVWYVSFSKREWQLRDNTESCFLGFASPLLFINSNICTWSRSPLICHLPCFNLVIPLSALLLLAESLQTDHNTQGNILHLSSESWPSFWKTPRLSLSYPYTHQEVSSCHPQPSSAGIFKDLTRPFQHWKEPPVLLHILAAPDCVSPISSLLSISCPKRGPHLCWALENIPSDLPNDWARLAPGTSSPERHRCLHACPRPAGTLLRARLPQNTRALAAKQRQPLANEPHRRASRCAHMRRLPSAKRLPAKLPGGQGTRGAEQRPLGGPHRGATTAPAIPVHADSGKSRLKHVQSKGQRQSLEA